MFSMITSARLVDEGGDQLPPIASRSVVMTITLGSAETGQYVVPCDTEDTMAFNFGYVTSTHTSYNTRADP